MSQFSFNANSWTPTATADTTNLANNTFMDVCGTTATIQFKHIEIYMGGEASASSLNFMVLGRDIVMAATPGALVTKQSLASNNPGAIATTAQACVTAGTAPQRGSSYHLLDLSFNSFGGVVRWVAAPGSEILTIGSGIASTTAGGGVNLSAFTAATSGQISAHMIFEQL